MTSQAASQVTILIYLASICLGLAFSTLVGAILMILRAQKHLRYARKALLQAQKMKDSYELEVQDSARVTLPEVDC